ncbi:MAG: hypothetical protein VKP72_13830 [bacterium]|nr:hypothetical protein [bacterium]
MEGHIQIRSRSADLGLPRPAATAPLPDPDVPKTPLPGDVQRVQGSSERLSALVGPDLRERQEALLRRLKQVQFRSVALADQRPGKGDAVDLIQRIQRARTPEELDKVELDVQFAEGDVTLREIRKNGDMAAEARAIILGQEARKAVFEYLERCRQQLSDLLQSLDLRSRVQSTHLTRVVAEGSEESLRALSRQGLTTDIDVSKPASLQASIL